MLYRHTGQHGKKLQNTQPHLDLSLSFSQLYIYKKKAVLLACRSQDENDILVTDIIVVDGIMLTER